MLRYALFPTAIVVLVKPAIHRHIELENTAPSVRRQAQRHRQRLAILGRHGILTPTIARSLSSHCCLHALVTSYGTFASGASGCCRVATEMPREYAAVQRNLSGILPSASALEIAQRAQALFSHFACFFADLLSLNRAAPHVQQRYIHDIHGVEHFTARWHQARVCGGNRPSGELGPAGDSCAGMCKTVHVVMAPEQNSAIQQFFARAKHSTWVTLLSNAEAGAFVQLLMYLRRAILWQSRRTVALGIVAIEWYVFWRSGAFAAWSFHPGCSSSGPGTPCFCLMRSDQRYEIFVREPLVVQRGQEETALRQMVNILERYVAMAPEQWCNFYDVWGA